MNKRIVGIYSVIHFIVDLSCAVLVTNLVSQKMGQNVNFLMAVLLYNFFAFAMQLPIGIIADKVNKKLIQRQRQEHVPDFLIRELIRGQHFFQLRPNTLHGMIPPILMGSFIIHPAP